MSQNHDWEILNIEVRTKSSVNQINLAEDLKVAMENINECFIEQPAKYAYWATVAAQAQSLVDHKKLEVDKQEEYLKKTLIGELDTEVRQELEMNGERVTETKVTNGIYVHPRYLEHQEILFELRQELLDLQENSTILNIAKDSMMQRKDVLISLGANMRNEGTNLDLSMKKATANDIINKNRRGKLSSVQD